ncbi:hypothetical protein D3C85_1273570 [compost metagenome]
MISTVAPGAACSTRIWRGTSIRASAGVMVRVGTMAYLPAAAAAGSLVTIMAAVRSLVMGVTFRPFLVAQMFL